MSAESVTRVMEPIRSRCLGIRIPCPKKEEIEQVLQKIAKKEGLVLPDCYANQLVTQSKGNLRKAILLLQVGRAIAYPFSQQQQKKNEEEEESWISSQETGWDWERLCYDIANIVIREQNPKQLCNIRNKLYELFCHAIPGDMIFRKITLHLLRMMDEEVAPQDPKKYFI
ncbi:Replication factor C subunit 3 [Galdieria sulphuraria]|nr:Replication factor C subunit 3 [Galdieria sulphuraria]